MDSRSVDTFIWIGTAIRFLQDCTAGLTAGDDTGVVGNYDDLIEWLEENHLYVSWNFARNNLGEIIEEVRNARESENESFYISNEQATNIRKGSDAVRLTIEAETQDFFAYVVTDKRYPAERLLNNPGELMAAGVYGSLPVIAQYDLRQACRCIAFELPTAAAFHLMRGTEDVLRFYYCSIVKQKRVRPLLWGPMVDGLKKRKTKIPPATLLNNLDNLRVSFRNPTQHPEKIYDIDEVQDLLNLCIDVINRMIKHLTVIGNMP